VVRLPKSAEQLEETNFSVKPETSPQYTVLFVLRFKTTQLQQYKSIG